MKVKEKQFRIGDKVTFKSEKDCINNSGKEGRYYLGGSDQGGHVGEILYYHTHFNEGRDCWKINVEVKGGSYDMLESEFLEYKQTTNEFFPLY